VVSLAVVSWAVLSFAAVLFAVVLFAVVRVEDWADWKPLPGSCRSRIAATSCRG